MIKTAIMWRGSPSDLATDVFDLLTVESDREAFLDALAKKIGCSKTALHDKIIREKEQVIERLCAEIDAHKRESVIVSRKEFDQLQVAKQFYLTHLDKKVIARADHLLYRTGDADAPESIKDRNGEVTLGLCRCCKKGEAELAETCEGKTPADRLADVAEEVLGRYRIERGSLIQNAIDEYRSTRNGIGATTAETFGSPPDPILVARHLLDCLTGGALASLICQVRDGIEDGRQRSIALGPHGLDNLKSNLRALGEKVE